MNIDVIVSGARQWSPWPATGFALLLVLAPPMISAAAPELSAGSHGRKEPSGLVEGGVARVVEKLEYLPWNPPPAVYEGGWSLELFSPPEIVFDENAGSLVRVEPGALLHEAPDARFDVRLISLHVESFPLRLIGHLGVGEAKRGVFEDCDTGEVFVAGTGAMTGRQIEVIELAMREDPAAASAGILAVMRRTGVAGIVSLEEGRPGDTGQLRAVLEYPSGVSRELGTGEAAEIDGVAYRVVAIDAAQLRVKIERQMPGSSTPEAAWLELTETEESDSAEDEEAH